MRGEATLRIRTDDEVYRVDAMWLAPDEAAARCGPGRAGYPHPVQAMNKESAT